MRARLLSFAMSVVARGEWEGVRFEVLGLRFDTRVCTFVFLSDIVVFVCPIECPLGEGAWCDAGAGTNAGEERPDLKYGADPERSDL